MAGAMALILAGSMAATTEAKPRGANALIATCFEANYDPYIFEFMNVVGVACPDMPNAVETNVESVRAADDAGAAAHGQHKAQKQHKHKQRAGKRGKR
jgi:hypothetical protein